VPDNVQLSDSPAFSAVYWSARREWNERYGDYIARARQWRLVAYVLAGTTAISTCAAVWSAQQAHVAPYVVQVDKLGESLAVARVPVAPRVDKARIEYQLAHWIVDIRTVGADPSTILRNATEAYSWIDKSSAAQDQLDVWFRSNPPNERTKKETVGVNFPVDNVTPIGADTWQVDWSEEHRPKDTGTVYTNYWRATITIIVKPPTDDATIQVNPAGLYVSWFNVNLRNTARGSS
jgi:type IV secretion system protein VirB5